MVSPNQALRQTGRANEISSSFSVRLCVSRPLSLVDYEAVGESSQNSFLQTFFRPHTPSPQVEGCAGEKMSPVRFGSSRSLGPRPNADAFGVHSTIRVSALRQPADPVIRIRRVAHSFWPSFAKVTLRWDRQSCELTRLVPSGFRTSAWSHSRMRFTPVPSLFTRSSPAWLVNRLANVCHHATWPSNAPTVSVPGPRWPASCVSCRRA